MFATSITTKLTQQAKREAQDKDQIDPYRTMAMNVGQDGAYLLDALDATADEEPVRQVAAVETLRAVWARRYERDGARERWRETPLPVSGRDELT